MSTPLGRRTPGRILAGGADVGNGTDPAVGLAGVTDAPPVEDESVAKLRPAGLGEERLKVLLDILGIIPPSESEAAGHAPDVRVHDDAGRDAAGVAENHVGGLAAHPRELDKVSHDTGDLARVAVDKGAGARHHAVCLGPEEACGAHNGLHGREIRSRQRLGIGESPEQPGRDGIHSCIRALSRQDGRDHELESVPCPELAVGVGMRPGQAFENTPGPARSGLVLRLPHGRIVGDQAAGSVVSPKSVACRKHDSVDTRRVSRTVPIEGISVTGH